MYVIITEYFSAISTSSRVLVISSLAQKRALSSWANLFLLFHRSGVKMAYFANSYNRCSFSWKLAGLGGILFHSTRNEHFSFQSHRTAALKYRNGNKMFSYSEMFLFCWDPNVLRNKRATSKTINNWGDIRRKKNWEDGNGNKQRGGGSQGRLRAQ